MANSPIKKHSSHHHSKGFFQNVLALVTGGVVAFVLVLIAQTGQFTADIMNQYGRSVDSFSGAEIVYQIGASGTVDVIAKRNYNNLSAMVFTLHYDTEVVSFDTSAFVSDWPVSISNTPNTLTMIVLASGDVAYDTQLLSLPYSASDPWIVQDKTVFMGTADFGGSEMEDLVVFTQTPPRPEGSQE